VIPADRFWAALEAGGVLVQARYLESAAFRLDPRHTLDLAAAIVEGMTGPASAALAWEDAEAAFARLDAPRVVCRSSAAMEDGRSAAFPGVFVSVLNLTSPGDLAVAIADCWRSVFSADALRYLLRVGSEPVDFSMAALLQRQVDAAWYGVYVSIDPLTGEPAPRADLSQAGPEALVGGGGATLRARRPSGGWTGVDEAMAASLEAVDRVARRLAAHLQSDVDLEFALPVAGGDPVILQCRPITHVTRGTGAATAGGIAGSPFVGRSCASGHTSGVAGHEIAVMEQVTTADYAVVFRSIGIVTERDASPLSHVAILCRELGIPFICGVEGARAGLLGRRVAMHGASGAIEILHDAELTPARPAAPAPPGELTISAVEFLLRLLAEGRPGQPPAAEADRIARRYARFLGQESVRVVGHCMSAPALERLGADLFGSGFSTALLFPNGPASSQPDDSRAQALRSGPVNDDTTELEIPNGSTGSDEHLLCIAFDKPSRATEVLVNLVHLQQEGALRLGDAVVISKDADGRAQIQETVDVTPGKAALIGGWLGMLAGIALGPLAIAGGVAAGALYGKLVDKGLADDWVKQMSEWLDAGRSALLLLVTVDDKAQVLRELGRYEGEVVSTDLPEPVRLELEQALRERGAGDAGG